MATTLKPTKRSPKTPKVTVKPKPMAVKMRRVTANLRGSFRIEKLHGREHLVLPVRMIVPGVLNGSNGPLLYPPSEVSRDPHDWNNMPIVVRHPTRNGKPISARSAEVLNKSGIGIVLGANFAKSLDAEAWFDIEKTIQVNKRLYERLAAGEPVELSTGLWTQNEPHKGIYKNKKYTHIARNYKPDHLAILPDEKGACSVNDGCGVNVNKKRTPSRNKPNSRGVKQMARKLRPEVKKQYIDNLIGNCSCQLKEKPISKGPWTEADRATLNKMPDEKLAAMEKSRVEAVNNARIAAVATKGIVDGETTFAFNAEKGGFVKTVKRTKTTNRRKRKPEPATVTNAEPRKKQRMTEKDFLAIMPASMKEDLLYARNEKKSKKAKLIKVITSNDANTFKEDYLQQKDLAELEALAKLAGPVENKRVKGDPRFTTRPGRQGNYAGAAGAFGSEYAENEEEEEEGWEDDEESELTDNSPLDIPTIDWEELAEENSKR